MTHYNYNSYKNQTRNKKPVTGYSLERLKFLSAPKERSSSFMPDKPSPYWLDYLIDSRPHKITDPVELMEYYQNYWPKLPRLEVLSRPKTLLSPCKSAISRSASAISSRAYVSHSRISQTISKKYHPVVPTVSQDIISLRPRPPTQLRETSSSNPQIYKPPPRQATAIPQKYKQPLKMKSSGSRDNRAFNYQEDDRGDMGPDVGDNSNIGP